MNRTLGLRAARGRGGLPGGRGTSPIRQGVSPVRGSASCGRGMPQPSSGRGQGVRRCDAMRVDNDDVQEIAPMTQSKVDKANWSEQNNNLLCQLLVEQIELGNYNKGTMTARGYKMIQEKYHLATNLHHNRKQFANRISQLKRLYIFIKDLHTRSGLGHDENGWPCATAEWWEEETKGHHEWKKLKYGPPEYLPLLKQIFEGVAVDGSTSFAARQPIVDAEEEYHGDADFFEVPHESPMSSGSQKRASSTSTTGTSPVKKSKSPVIKMMKEFLTVSSKQAEQHYSLLQKMALSRLGGRKDSEIEKEDRMESEIEKAQSLALEAGVDLQSVEYYVVSHICKDPEIRKFFIRIPTPEGRLTFLKRYCVEKNLK